MNAKIQQLQAENAAQKEEVKIVKNLNLIHFSKSFDYILFLIHFNDLIIFNFN